MAKSSISAKRLSFSGILLALAMITLFLASVLPTGKLSLYALSSFFVSIIIIEYGIRNGWLFYIASSLLSLIVMQVKLRIIPYILFFGAYGIAKFYIEKLKNLVLEILLKLLYFNVSVALVYLLVKELFSYEFSAKFAWWAIIAALQFIFLIYDYVYTLFIQYYNSKLKNFLRIS